MRSCIQLPVFLLLAASGARGETLFLEAETFTISSDGWQISRNRQARRASRAATLWGAGGAGESTAAKTVRIKDPGAYRIWVRYMQHSRWRGPFRLAIGGQGEEIAAKAFDLEPKTGVEDWDYLWDHVDVDLPAGVVSLVLSKHENRNCAGYVRHVDCLLLTRDKELVPDHIPRGPQTYLRVTLGDVYQRPVYLHVFADHYRSPWYAHYALAKDGTEQGISPRRPQAMLTAGETTPWCNITRMLYQHSGARLVVSARYTYRDIAARLQARFDFATAPDEKSIVRTIDEDRVPGGLFLIMPPDLTTPENVAKFITDREMAEETGRIADSMQWPAIGRKPQRFPFFVRVAMGEIVQPDREITRREWKTLDYFGFSNRQRTFINGKIWQYQDGCYCRPRTAKMKERAEHEARLFRESGKSADKIVFCRLTDEPRGPPSAHLAGCEACTAEFRKWLKSLGKTPADLLETTWRAVKPVEETQRDKHPALHYYTQRFRTRVLGGFMLTQSRILRDAYRCDFPVNASFSDGAIFFANFCAQGVDYFELLDSKEQSSLFVSDWSNLASTFQCGSFNTELMRAAAGEYKQQLVQYLIAYAHCTPWEIKLKASSEVGRGVKALVNFFYGPAWGSHEGGPPWRSSVWYCKPETWPANAEIVREIGWAEDFLVPATRVPARTALLYASSTDIWTFKRNYAYGFDRMNTWLALAHAQVPLDIVSEKHVAEGKLDHYHVCYFAGPNITHAAAVKLKQWVRAGGVLVLSAGAGSRDEFNRTLELLEEILPAERAELEQPQPHLSYGRAIRLLSPQDHVTWGDARIEVLSVKEKLTPRAGAKVLATFQDGSAALVRADAGRGTVYVAGFLPGLAYVKAALLHRKQVEQQYAGSSDGLPDPVGVDPAKALLDRSSSPWHYPAEIRNKILRPVREARVAVPLTCSEPLVDAVCMECAKGLLIPLANYTLRPLDEIRLTVRSDRPIDRVQSAHQGSLSFELKTATGLVSAEPGTKPSLVAGRSGELDRCYLVEFRLPLGATDFVKCHYKRPRITDETRPR